MRHRVRFLLVGLVFFSGPVWGMTFKQLGPGGGGTPGCLAVDSNDPKIAYVYSMLDGNG